VNHTQDKAAAMRLTGKAKRVWVMMFSFRHTCAFAAGIPVPEGNVVQIWQDWSRLREYLKHVFIALPLRLTARCSKILWACSSL
jgi:hypothetical protein